MIIDWSKVRVFVKPGATDMRKQINGLSIIVSEDLEMDPFGGNLFLFCNKRRKLLKILYWDTNGFCMWLKRFEKDKFPWPMNRREAGEIAYEQLSLLLEGIDFWHAHKRLAYSRVV